MFFGFDCIVYDLCFGVFDVLRENVSFYWFGFDSMFNDWNCFFDVFGVLLLGLNLFFWIWYLCGLIYLVDSFLMWEFFVREVVLKL